MTLRFEDIAEILKIIDSSSCDELVVETGGMKLVVRRNSAGSPVVASAGPAIASSPAAASSPVPTLIPAQASKPQPARPTVVPVGQHFVSAPMVGTFYRAPSPGAAPFVEVGSVVKPGDTLCIIEVMKLMTTIKAEVAGRIAEIGAENGELVEFARLLFTIAPA